MDAINNTYTAMYTHNERPFMLLVRDSHTLAGRGPCMALELGEIRDQRRVAARLYERRR